MKKEIENKDFQYEYTGAQYSERELLFKGLKPLTGKQLRKLITNKTVYGDYTMGYKFIADIHESGDTEGINHVGSRDFGKWTIDEDANTLQLVWENHWLDTVTRAYEMNGHIEFYDVDTGRWRTSFKIFENWEKE
ncbi:MAG TPA: hypothetical protein ENK85_11095 [Saprospiraceae bacterium]|nr:hypothetical protein [Saprospiraceae bacterium]